MIIRYQSAFVVGRLIQNNVIITQKVYHHMRLKNNDAQEECALKLDMQKAYDRVKWEFLIKALQKWGFEEKRIWWIENIV